MERPAHVIFLSKERSSHGILLPVHTDGNVAPYMRTLGCHIQLSLAKSGSVG